MSEEQIKKTKFKKVAGCGYFKSLATKGRLVSSIDIGITPNGKILLRIYRVKGISPLVEIAVFEPKDEETAKEAWDRALESAKMLSEGP